MEPNEYKAIRDSYLKAILSAATRTYPASPTSKPVIMWEGEESYFFRGSDPTPHPRTEAFLIGEAIGLSPDVVKRCVNELINLGFIQTPMGLSHFRLTQAGIEYVLQQGERKDNPLNLTHNTIVMGDNAKATIQQGTFTQSALDGELVSSIRTFMLILPGLIGHLEPDQANEIRDEIDRLKRDLEKGREVGPRGKVFGAMLKEMLIKIPSEVATGLLKGWLGW